MDTSEQYIKMCEKAVEIQAKYNGRHYRIWVPDNAGFFADTEHSILYRHKLGDIPIWLPHQDQLQEMLDPCGYLVFLRAFPDFAFNLDPYHSGIPWSSSLLSMEQLWLAFVMKQHNKVWNGEDWVLQEEQVGRA